MDKERNIICNIVCGVPECNADIDSCKGSKSLRCKKQGKSFIENMNERQVAYVMSELKQNTFLKACPGSGKTEVLAIKTALEKEIWESETSGFAVLTFTNSAESEITNRIEAYTNEKLGYPHFVGTFTSWLHGYVANPFLHKITGYKGDDSGDKSIKLIENDSNSDFLNVFCSQYGYRELGHIKAHEFFVDYKTDEYKYCGSRNKDGIAILHELLEQDAWRINDLKKIKEKFWKYGFGLYEDIEYLCCTLLRKYPEISELISKRFPVIFVDECQDLSYVQLNILDCLLEKGTKIHLIGDLNQAIYGFRNIEPQDTKEFIEVNNFKEVELTENYRSCQLIVDASRFVVGEKNNVVGKNDNRSEKPLIAILYTKGKEQEAVDKFHDYLTSGKLDADESRIIVRNKNLKNKLLGIKRREQATNILEEIAKIVYLLDHEDCVDDYRTVFSMLAKNVQKVFFKTSEHLNSNFFYKPCELEMEEWKRYLSIVRSKLKEEKKLLDFSMAWGQWKKQLDAFMKKNICNLEEFSNCPYELGAIRRGNKDKCVDETLFKVGDNKLLYRIETIHGCKGMSLDAVLFMSAYQASNDEHSGGYWKQWFDVENIGEENRLAYVAFSRARYLLALGIPKPKTFSEEDRQILYNVGFEIVE